MNFSSNIFTTLIALLGAFCLWGINEARILNNTAKSEAKRGVPLAERKKNPYKGSNGTPRVRLILFLISGLIISVAIWST